MKRTLAALSAITMLFTTANVLPDGIIEFNTGITANAAETEQQATDEASVTIDGAYTTLEEAFSAASGKTSTITMLNDAECIKDSSPVGLRLISPAAASRWT